MSTKEPLGKRTRKSLSRVASLANIFSPVKPVKKISQSLQRSLSFKNVLSPAMQKPVSQYKKPQPTPTKRRPSKLWQETVDGDVTVTFSELQIKRQNAIFELFQGEQDLIQDLQMVKTTYYDSMKKLQLLTDDELSQIFSIIDTLVPLHEKLVASMLGQRKPDGSTDQIGQVLIDWLPSLHCYIPYCANQVYAKALLDAKRQDKRVDDFLQRCQDSPFSRRLDLWSFLDVPRNRLVKYPLLLKNIQKLTPTDHSDIALLDTAIRIVEDFLADVDEKTGEAKCKFIIGKLDFIEEKQRHSLFDEVRYLLCEGILRNNRGTKLTVFLFDKILVLTRPATRQDRMVYQVYRYPLPVTELIVEDVKDGEIKMGSFRNMYGAGQASKNVFRLGCSSQDGKGYSHTLQSNDEHDKKQWIQCLQAAVKANGEIANILENKAQSVAMGDSYPSDTSVNSEDTSSIGEGVVFGENKKLDFIDKDVSSDNESTTSSSPCSSELSLSEEDENDDNEKENTSGRSGGSAADVSIISSTGVAKRSMKKRIKKMFTEKIPEKIAMISK
ncbi:rho guanine nucleotide exchange factor 3-like [Tubulanus polymorphus]|uniref:rho guanine nucleotide exchange factor 3-like n=1 Tax=Tubulanus polymorphus TaxID=672921 RepID=UPI003DA21711